MIKALALMELSFDKVEVDEIFVIYRKHDANVYKC